MTGLYPRRESADEILEAAMVKSFLKKLRRSKSKFLILSLFLHASFFLFLVVQHLRPLPPPASEVVEVSYEPPATPIPPTSKDKTDKRSKPRVLPKQVVEQSEHRINDEKTDTRFLSRFDQTVIKQTRSKDSGAFNNTPDIANARSGALDGQKAKSKVTKSPDTNKGELPKLSDLRPQFSLTPTATPEDVPNPGHPSQTDDYLKDVNVGAQTLLSTKEFVFYSYYQRIKDQLRQNWEPTVREKVKILYRKGRTIASSHDRVTQVMITLDPRGVLERVDVLNESGVKDLDDAAIEAFRKSAPFPNPPKGIVDPDGHIHIRWDFILEA
jgi:protein TonB